MRYLTQNDAVMRIGASIITYKGDVVFADRGGAEQEENNAPAGVPIKLTHFHANGAPVKRKLTVDANDTDLDVTSLPLGYLSTGASDPDAFYACRGSFRRQKQGLSADNVVFSRITVSDGRLQSVGAAHSITHPAFIRMLKGVYVPVDEALNTLLSENVAAACPVSIDFCIYRERSTLYLLHHTTLVGIATLPQASFTLLPEMRDNSVLLMEASLVQGLVVL
jgi:hypothetical protein